MKNTKRAEKTAASITDDYRSILDLFNHYHVLLSDLRQMAARIDTEILHALERRASKAIPEAVAIIASKPPMRWPGAPTLVPVLIPGEQILTEPVPGWHKLWEQEVERFEDDLVQMLFGAYSQKMDALTIFLRGMWQFRYNNDEPQVQTPAPSSKSWGTPVDPDDEP